MGGWAEWEDGQNWQMGRMGRAGLLAALIAIGLVWGMTIPLTKVAVSTGHHPAGLILWQVVFGALFLGAVVAARGLRLGRLTRAGAYLGAVALIGTVIPNSTSFLAARHLPAGVMGLNIAVIPMVALVLAHWAGAERATARRLLGVAFGAAAILLLVGPEASLPDPGATVFVLVALIAPLCYGAEGVFIAKRAPRDLDPIETLFGASVLAAILMAPIALSQGWAVDLGGAWAAPEWAMLAAALLHAIAYSGYIWLVGRAGPVFTSQLSYVVTIASVALSMTVLGERYSTWVWLAFALMLGGLALVQPRAEEEAAPPKTDQPV